MGAVVSTPYFLPVRYALAMLRRVAYALLVVAIVAAVVVVTVLVTVRVRPGGGDASTPEETAATVRVTRVVDGDTVDVCCPQARVRLLGIDTPERNEPLFQEATALTARLTTGQVVRMERCEEEADQYGRLLRHLFVGERHVNRELVAAGLARAYIFSLRLNPCYAGDLLAAEGVAQKQRIGLWQRGVP